MATPSDRIGPLFISECELCGEECRRQDRALVSPLVAHRECLLRSTMGGIGHLIAHDYWCSERHEPDAGLTYRQSALLVDVFVVIVGVEESVRRG